MKYIALLIGIIIGGLAITQVDAQTLRTFISTQLATDPTNGECLTTDGTNNVWSSSCGSGGTGSNWTIVSGGLQTATTTDFARASYFVATGTTATSTFAGNMTIDGVTRLKTSLTGLLRADSGVVSTNATGTLTETATGLEFSATRDLVGGSAILSLTSGYVIPTTTDFTNWNTAYASTTALTPSYIRNLFSSTATGLTYTGATGITALTAGYNIPLSASTTNWNGFYDTPSTRITAGNGLAWTGNTLSATNTHNPVTLAGEDYLSLSTQLITANAIDPDNLSASDFGSFTCNGTTCTVDNGAISNAMLANSSVSYGGISLSLGGTDATPAFNLADATGLPISTGVSGLGTGVASFLATPSSANLDTAVTDDTGSGALVFGTSPTLTSFFGTPCTGNTFLQDISDTGSFTCTEATGSGGGGGSLSTTTDIIGVPTNTPELVSYVTGDVMFGGSASTTAEFQFDDDGSQFIISSSSANATGTILTNNSAQALRFGDDDGDMIEMYFGTAGDIILSALGTITDWVFNMNLYVQTGKNIFLGAVQWNSGDNIDGEVIANDTIDDDSIDLVDITLADFTNDAGFITNDTSVSLTADVTGILPQANGGTGTTTQLVWSRTIASTSIEFINGSLMPLTLRLDGGTITRIVCKVDGGTSKIIAIEDASANSSEDITCAATPTADDGSITNATYTSLEEMYIDFGATSGAVDHVSISVYK
jgi:hypothetical protein